MASPSTTIQTIQTIKKDRFSKLENLRLAIVTGSSLLLYPHRECEMLQSLRPSSQIFYSHGRNAWSHSSPG